jgi:tRNA 2-thiouridine synthesizing protein E
MEAMKTARNKILVDENGFLARAEDWNEDVAHILAEREGVKDLTDEKMEIVRFMRNYYAKHHAFPILNYVCKNIHQPRECVSGAFDNPMTAWKIAGLPDPSTISFVKIDGDHYHMEECC